MIGQSSKNNYKEIQDLRERTKILEGQKENLNKQSELLKKGLFIYLYVHLFWGDSVEKSNKLIAEH